MRNLGGFQLFIVTEPKRKSQYRQLNKQKPKACCEAVSRYEKENLSNPHPINSASATPPKTAPPHEIIFKFPPNKPRKLRLPHRTAFWVGYMPKRRNGFRCTKSPSCASEQAARAQRAIGRRGSLWGNPLNVFFAYFLHE